MNNNNPSSEKLSFWQLIAKTKIEIPIIQRDYAQGRRDMSELRNSFLDALTEVIEGDSVELDFVFGSKNEGSLQPLDGQQRLTTLFLLHWYSAYKENKLAEAKDALQKFTYEIRTSSREFCNELVQKGIDFENLLDADESKHNQLSKTLMDASWFVLSWKRDPTIEAMLIMLDAIHEKFKNAKNVWGKLTTENKITFQYIDLENFGLSDDLYIKMNARGKALTEFENLKAKLEQLLEKKDLDNKTKIKHEFSLKIDTEWTDLFWNYKEEETHLLDNQFMNFFRVVATNNYALRTNESVLANNLKLLVGKDNPENDYERTKKMDYYKYDEMNCFDDKCINDIIGTLDYLKNGTGKILVYLPDNQLLDENGLFKKVIRNSHLTYTDRIQFYALYQYLILNSPDNGLVEWMRIIRNLSENTIYNDVVEYAASIKSIAELLPYSKDILSYISDSNNSIKGFAAIQIEEERIKSLLIVKNDEWKDAVAQIENHGYFKGQIGFVLKFCGITDYYDQNKNLHWPNDDSNNFYEVFINYGKKSKWFFTQKGLRKFDNFLFERALLSKGDYLLAKGKNHSFLIDAFDRDISWKRLLRSSDQARQVEDDRKRNYVKEVFDSINLATAESDLNQISESCNNEGWERYFIKYPEIIAACGTNKFIRRGEESKNDILLLEKSATNGYHREYYSYALYLNIHVQGNIAKYVQQSSVECDKYICNINGRPIKIAYLKENQEWKYKIEIDDSNKQYFDSDREVIIFLTHHGYINTPHKIQ